MRKIYLGDGAYAQFDGFNVVVTTGNGIRNTNTIVLEPEVARALVTFIEECHKG